jgi:hypothetical protein
VSEYFWKDAGFQDMFEMGQHVRIREQVWEVVEDRASGSDDHLLLVTGIEQQALQDMFAQQPASAATTWLCR